MTIFDDFWDDRLHPPLHTGEYYIRLSNSSWGKVKKTRLQLELDGAIWNEQISREISYKLVAHNYTRTYKQYKDTKIKCTWQSNLKTFFLSFFTKKAEAAADDLLIITPTQCGTHWHGDSHTWAVVPNGHELNRERLDNEEGALLHTLYNTYYDSVVALQCSLEGGGGGQYGQRQDSQGWKGEPLSCLLDFIEELVGRKMRAKLSSITINPSRPLHNCEMTEQHNTFTSLMQERELVQALPAHSIRLFWDYRTVTIISLVLTVSSGFSFLWTTVKSILICSIK